MITVCILLVAVKKNIYAYASRISRYINREADHKWLEGSRYTSATEQQQGKDFTISSPGDCLLSYLTVLLFAAMAPRGRAVEFSLETFHNKEYAARIKLDANELSKQGYAEECAMRLKEESLCTPAHHIIRFLDTAKDILKPWKTVCRHGKSLTGLMYNHIQVIHLNISFDCCISGLGTCVGGHITESGANAVIQCDVIKLNDCMNIKSKTISELFAYKPEEKKEKTSAGDESDGSYESDEEESLDSESSDDEREGVQHLRPEAQPEAPPRPEAPPEAPSHTTQKSNVMPGFKTGFLFSAARQFLHMFHSFCGMLPLLLCANAYPRGNFEAFFKVPITLLATVIRFQLYLPVIRYVHHISTA